MVNIHIHWKVSITLYTHMPSLIHTCTHTCICMFTQIYNVCIYTCAMYVYAYHNMHAQSFRNLSHSSAHSRCTDTGLAACTRRACLDPCNEPVSPGTCEDSVTQYFFNSESRQCERFEYSGCGGNSNRFSSAIDCLRSCKPESQCYYM